MLGIVLQMELATLPRNRWKNGIPNCLQSLMGIGGKKLDPIEPSVFQTAQKIRPMDLALG